MAMAGRLEAKDDSKPPSPCPRLWFDNDLQGRLGLLLDLAAFYRKL